MLNRIKRKLKSFIKQDVYVVQNIVEISNVLSGKNAIVIGGGTGIGKAISLKLKSAGCNVIVASRNPQNISEGISSIIWDVRDINSMDSILKEIHQKYGQIDIVINSQGICPDIDFRQKWDEVSINEFQSVLETNLTSVYFICQKMSKYYIKNKIKGHILNIASTEGLKGSIVPYGLSKNAVISLTKGFGKNMARFGIVINGIAPGATATDMMKMNSNNNISLDYIPSGRATKPEEIANVALMLVSDSGQNMCGSIVTIDGGESL